MNLYFLPKTMNPSAPKHQPIQQVTLEIWQPDDFYNLYVSTSVKLNDLVHQGQTLTGIIQKSSPVPSRSEVSNAPSCVFLPYEQFENAAY